MEILVSLFVGFLGAGSTIYAARMQIIRSDARKQTFEGFDAKETTSVSDDAHDNACTRTSKSSQEVAGTLIYPGSSKFQEWQYGPDPNQGYYFSSISVYLDGEQIGSGDGYKGFNFEFTTKPGLHDISFQWEKTKDFGEFNKYEPGRSDMSLVFERGGNVRLRFSPSFDLASSEPSGLAKQVSTPATIMWMIGGGIGMIVIAILIAAN